MDLVNRLKFFLEKNNIAISQFADTCGIPRPTLSQILNGRNKKISDELISKIHAAYPALSVLWLMFGEGSMDSDTNIKTSEPQNAHKNDDNVEYGPVYERSATENVEFPAYTDFSPEKSKPADFTDFTGETDSLTGMTTPGQTPANLFSAPEQQMTATVHRPDSQHEPSLPEGSISFYPRHDGRPPQKVRSHYTPEIDTITATDTDNRDSSYGSNDAETYVATDNFAPTSDSTPASHDTPEHIKDTPLTSPPESISVPADPAKKITNIVVFYSDNSFQSFYPS